MKTNTTSILTLSNGNYFQSVNQGDALCDGSLSSFIEVGLKAVLQKLLHHDMDTVVTMLTNMVGYTQKKEDIHS